MKTILIATSIQAWFFIILILSTKKSKQNYDYLLAAWLFIIGLHTLLYYVMHQTSSINFYSAIINAAIPFLQGPFLYLYVRTKSVRKSKISWTDMIHFIPFIAFIVYQLINSYVPYDQNAPDSKYIYKSFFQDFNVFVIFFLISLPIYIWLSYSVYRKRLLSYGGESSVWIKMLILFVAGIWISSLLSFLAPEFINHTFQLGFNSLVFISLTGFVYLISYFGIKQNIFHTDIPKISVSKYAKSKLSEDEAHRIWSLLKEHIKKVKPHLDSEVDPKKLSSQIDVSTHKLSQVINTKSGLSFNDFINKHRIEAVKNMMKSEKHQHLSLLGMALEAGFTSKATFNRAFKKLENCTPSQYLDQLKS